MKHDKIYAGNPEPQNGEISGILQSAKISPRGAEGEVLIVQVSPKGIRINDIPVQIENPQKEGVHLVVINTSNGQVEISKMFSIDGKSQNSEFEDFVEAEASQIPDGHIVVA